VDGPSRYVDAGSGSGHLGAGAWHWSRLGVRRLVRAMTGFVLQRRPPRLKSHTARLAARRFSSPFTIDNAAAHRSGSVATSPLLKSSTPVKGHMLASDPADRLHNPSSPTAHSNRGRQPTTLSAGQFWTPIPRLRGSELHAELRAVVRVLWAWSQLIRRRS
jgi:hypothetical protein